MRSSLILYNANVLTMDKNNPRAEAVGIIDNKISFVGQNNEILNSQRSPTTMCVDMQGKTVIPGFIDSHVHFLHRGLQLSELDLRDACSVDDVLSKLKVKAKETEKGRWIIGYGWDETKWVDSRFITRKDIDNVAPDNPVVLKRVCMHLWVLNSRAIELLYNVHKGLLSVESGASSEDANLSTGCVNISLRGDVNEMLKVCFNPSEDELQDALQRAQEEAVRSGITSVHEMTPHLDTLKRANEQKKLFIRHYACSSHDCGVRSAECGIIPHPDILRIGAVKIYTDGSLGARTAALKEPYADEEGSIGTLTWSQQELDDIVARVHSEGRQVAIHAIGDRAVASALDAIEKALTALPRQDHRHRIEHCELADDEMISRIRDLNIIVSAQPNFIGNWGGRGGLYNQRLGTERWQMMNPLAKFKDKGIHAAFGSDGMPVGPMYGIWSCVSHPVQESRLSPEDAIYFYTHGGAYASFDETKKGAIEVGKLADIVVLSDDITSVHQSRIKDTEVIMAIIGGKVCLDVFGLTPSPQLIYK